MAFHFACPITCRRICDCELGFPAGLRGRGERGEFLEEIWRLEEFLQVPWSVRAEGGGATVQVEVPRVVPSPAVAGDLGADEEDAVAAFSAQAKAVNASSLAAEDYIRRLESVGAAEVQGLETREDRGSSIVKTTCLICFSGEMEGGDRAIKMLSCKICSKKYHRSCLRSWAEYRDLFRWNSWACPSCRSCEVCRRAGDPNKLMYCKRCDAAYHCYCQQPPHKNVNHGPYFCPKHTRCHSCGSSVPGSGHSTRWFLGYTCCDACGRLFVKGNYCPVCLKVYRDSETTPMVCCDVCERWVHCNCDGISDERYQQFQADHNLQYKCAACRGDCYRVKDIDDAVRELWKRRDESDRNQIASLSAAAGLPLEEISSFSHYSDGEQGGPVILKNNIGRTVKFSVKGLSDKSTSNSKESKLVLNKKYAKDMGYQIKFVHKREDQHLNFEGLREARSLESSFRDHKMDDQDLNTKVQIKGRKIQGLHIKGCAGKTETKSENLKGTKLVFHLGAKNRNPSSSPKSETSSCHREQDIVASYATISGKSDRGRSSKHGDEEKDLLKIGNATDMRIKTNGKIAEECELPTISTSIPITEKRTRIGPSDLKPLLKLKFKNPYFEQQSWASRGEKENPVKGQRSKRKRPLLEVGFRENECQKNPADEAMDAKILQKLGKDAIGKRIEVHQPLDNSWHHGVVSSIVQGSSSSLTVRLDDGRSSILELGKQGVRFGTQKRKRAHT